MEKKGVENFVENSGREAWVSSFWIAPLLFGVAACFAIGGWQVQTWQPKWFYLIVLIVLVTRLLKFGVQSLVAPLALPSHLDLASIQAERDWSYLVFPSWYHLLYLAFAISGLLLGRKWGNTRAGSRSENRDTHT